MKNEVFMIKKTTGGGGGGGACGLKKILFYRCLERQLISSHEFSFLLVKLLLEFMRDVGATDFIFIEQQLHEKY